jgi:hypothetical protein
LPQQKNLLIPLASDVNNPDTVGHFANRISAFIFAALQELGKKEVKDFYCTGSLHQVASPFVSEQNSSTFPATNTSRNSDPNQKRTIPTERPPLVGEVIANFCG